MRKFGDILGGVHWAMWELRKTRKIDFFLEFDQKKIRYYARALIGASLIPVPIDEEGLIPDELESILRREKVSALYTSNNGIKYCDGLYC